MKRWLVGSIISAILIILVSIGAADSWTDEGNYVYDTWYNSEDTNFEISSINELAGFAYLVNSGTDSFQNKTVTLTADISAEGKSWIAIGNASNAFGGIFDGGSHTISGLNIINTSYNGFFGVIGDSCIKNVTVSGRLEYTANPQFRFNGGLCGYAENSTFINCTNSVSVKSASYPYMISGGIVGCSGGAIKIVRCINTAEVTGCVAGGILGCANFIPQFSYFHNKQDTLIYDCKNTGNVIGEFAGGMISTLCGGEINHCINEGTISDMKYYFTSVVNGRSIGGIAGGLTVGRILNCSNYGTIQGSLTSSESYPTQAGGIVGYSKYMDNTAGDASVENCYNSVDGVMIMNTGSNIAGVVGANGYVGAVGTVDNVYTIGSITYKNADFSHLAIGRVFHGPIYRAFGVKDSSPETPFDVSRTPATGSSVVLNDAIASDDPIEECGRFDAITQNIEKLTFEGYSVTTVVDTNQTLLTTLNSHPSISTGEYLPWTITQISNTRNNFYPVFAYPVTFNIYLDDGRGNLTLWESQELVYNISAMSVDPANSSTDPGTYDLLYESGTIFNVAANDTVQFKALDKEGYDLVKVSKQMDWEIVEAYETKPVEEELTSDSGTYSFTMAPFPTIVNVVYMKRVDVRVVKIWDDVNNKDESRPEELSISLKIGDRVITDVNGDEASFTLPVTVHDDTTDTDTIYWEKTYTLFGGDYSALSAVEDIPDGYDDTGYSRTKDKEGNYTFVLINSHTPELTPTVINSNTVLTDVEATKVWKWENDSPVVGADLPTPSITMELYDSDSQYVKDGDKTDTRTTENVITQTYTFTDVPKYVSDEDDAALATYFIEEDITDSNWVRYENIIESEDPDVDPTVEVSWYSLDGMGKYTAVKDDATKTVTNSYSLLQTTGSITVTKIWKDHSGEEGARPTKIRVGFFTATSDEPVYVVELVGTTALNTWSKEAEIALYVDNELIDFTTLAVLKESYMDADGNWSEWKENDTDYNVTVGGQDYTYHFSVQE